MKQVIIKKVYTYFDKEEQKKFRKWLIDANLRLGDISYKLCISYNYLYYIINGKRPVTNKLLKELDKLGYKTNNF